MTGGQDTVINVFSLQEPTKDEPAFSLIGHSENVCALDARTDGTIISGSWDRCVELFLLDLVPSASQDGACLAELHTGVRAARARAGSLGRPYARWQPLPHRCVSIAPAARALTCSGSADKTIKLWDQHKLAHTFKGHKDVVRGLARIPDIGFASCSNDRCLFLCVWRAEADADAVRSTYGLWVATSCTICLDTHRSSTLSLSFQTETSSRLAKTGRSESGKANGHPNRPLRALTCGTDGQVAQVIVHPAISVWTVSTMPNGDIVSGCSDGVVRVFSEAAERWVSEGDLRAYDAGVAQQALPSYVLRPLHFYERAESLVRQQVGDVKKSDLPGLEALTKPGTPPKSPCLISYFLQDARRARR